MNNLADRIDAGCFNLSNLPTYKLEQMASETTCNRLRDKLGCEIMYRRKL